MSDARATVASTTAVLAAPRTEVATAETTGPQGGRRIPWGTVLVHAGLLLAVAVIAFPLYYAFVISTQDLQEVVQKPPRLLPSATSWPTTPRPGAARRWAGSC